MLGDLGDAPALSGTVLPSLCPRGEEPACSLLGEGRTAGQTVQGVTGCLTQGWATSRWATGRRGWGLSTAPAFLFLPQTLYKRGTSFPGPAWQLSLQTEMGLEHAFATKAELAARSAAAHLQSQVHGWAWCPCSRMGGQ